MKRVPKYINIRGKKYGLILNGNYTTKSNATSFARKVKKLLDDNLKVSIRKIEPGKYVVYMKGAKGTDFTNRKSTIK